MTHAEATHAGRAGTPPSACPGELDLDLFWPPTQPLGRAAAEPFTEVYACRDCKRKIVLRDGALVNDYAVPPAGQVAETGRPADAKRGYGKGMDPAEPG